ncbi:MAG TPA: chorismate mutase [Methanotrichaceae archaeon]|nr:chorismate mutase [Methanotrichaceae archaeon]
MDEDTMGLSEIRSEVEGIDAEIIGLIHRRVQLSKDILEAKMKAGLDISDPKQEKLVMKRAVDLATELNLDAGAVKEIMAILIDMSVKKQREIQGEESP